MRDLSRCTDTQQKFRYQAYKQGSSGNLHTRNYTLYTVPSLNIISFRSCILSAAFLASLLPNISSVPKPSLTSGTRSVSSTIPSAPRDVVKTWSSRLRKRFNLVNVSLAQYSVPG